MEPQPLEPGHVNAGSFRESGLPDYDDLPAAPHGGRSAWGLFGPDDHLGLVNLMTS